MKSAIAPVLLAIAAVVQALGRYVYHQDTIVVTGELFFPIFLAALGIFYGLRAKDGAFSTVKLGLGILAVVALALTVAGWGMTLFWFYPSIWVYYSAFLLLVINAVIAVISTPSGKQVRAERAAAAQDPDQERIDTASTEDVESDGGWRTARR